MSKKVSIYRSWRKALYGYLALARISNSPTVVSNTLAGGALAGALWPDGKLGLIAIDHGSLLHGWYVSERSHGLCRRLPREARTATTSRYRIPVSSRCSGPHPVRLRQPAPVGCGRVRAHPFLSGLVLIALIICYDRWHKSNPLSPLLMALCRLMVYITALYSFQTAETQSRCGSVLQSVFQEATALLWHSLPNLYLPC